MSTEDSKSRGLKIGLVVAGIILIFLVSVQLFFSFYLDSYVEDKLTEAVSDQTDGQYELIFDELNLSVWSRSLNLESIHLEPADRSSTAPKLDLESLSIDNIGLFTYLTEGNIDVGDVRLSGPYVSLVQNSQDSLRFLRSSNQSSNKQSNLPEIEVDQFEIQKGSVRYWKPNENGIRGELHDFNLKISDIRIDSASLREAPYAEFENLHTISGPFQYELNNGLYSINSHGMEFSASNRSASIDSLQLIPEYPRYEFYREVGHQIDRFDLTIGKLLFEDADMEKIKRGNLKLGKITIQNANLDVFRSKEIPRPHKRPKKLAPVIFKELQYPITIDTIEVKETNISYSEQLEKVTEPGTVTFSNMNGTFTGVTNDSSAISEGHTIYLDVTTELMNESTLEAHFEFPMQKNGRHMASGSLGTLEAEKLNPILEPVGLIRAESGTIHSLYFDMNLGPVESTGVVELRYSDLEIEVLDAENVEGGGRQFFKTLLANLLKIKEDNNEEPLRSGEVSFERVQYKAIFNYWWKSLSSGLKDNIGL